MAIRYGIILVLTFIVTVPSLAQQSDTTKKSGDLREFNLWLDEGIKNTDKKSESDEKATNGRPLLKVDIDDIEPPKTESTDTKTLKTPDERTTSPQPAPEIDLNKEVPEKIPEVENKTVPVEPTALTELRDEIAQLRAELDQLRQKVDQMAVNPVRQPEPVAPSAESQLHVRTEREPFYPFWLPQR